MPHGGTDCINLSTCVRKICALIVLTWCGVTPNGVEESWQNGFISGNASSKSSKQFIPVVFLRLTRRRKTKLHWRADWIAPFPTFTGIAPIMEVCWTWQPLRWKISQTCFDKVNLSYRFFLLLVQLLATWFLRGILNFKLCKTSECFSQMWQLWKIPCQFAVCGPQRCGKCSIHDFQILSVTLWLWEYVLARACLNI